MLFGVELPPLMLTVVEFVPAIFSEEEPPAFSPATPTPPLLISFGAGLPPRTPGCLPSGEMETRAARFPCGGALGATGPGVAERAMSVEALGFIEFWRASSGAGPASFAGDRCCATRGAAPAFNSNFGRAGAFGIGANVISAGAPSVAGTSGNGAAFTVALRCSRG